MHRLPRILQYAPIQTLHGHERRIHDSTPHNATVRQLLLCLPSKAFRLGPLRRRPLSLLPQLCESLPAGVLMVRRASIISRFEICLNSSTYPSVCQHLFPAFYAFWKHFSLFHRGMFLFVAMGLAICQNRRRFFGDALLLFRCLFLRKRIVKTRISVCTAPNCTDSTVRGGFFYLPRYSARRISAISSGVSLQPPCSHIRIMALRPLRKNSI